MTHFKRSTKSSNKLTEIQKQNGLQPKKLINDVETRWNSTFDMLVRFTELEMSIRTTIALLDKDVDVLLPEEWLLAQKIKLVLQPMKELTDFISGEKYPSASSVIIVIQGIQEDLKELKTKKENHAVFGLMESLESELMMRVGSLEESSIFTNSTFLDPRYKNIFFSKEETADLTKKNYGFIGRRNYSGSSGPNFAFHRLEARNNDQLHKLQRQYSISFVEKI